MNLNLFEFIHSVFFRFILEVLESAHSLTGHMLLTIFTLVFTNQCFVKYVSTPKFLVISIPLFKLFPLFPKPQSTTSIQAHITSFPVVPLPSFEQLENFSKVALALVQHLFIHNLQCLFPLFLKFSPQLNQHLWWEACTRREKTH